MHQNNGTGTRLAHSRVNHLADTGFTPVAGINIPQDRSHAIAIVHMVHQSLIRCAVRRPHHTRVRTGNTAYQVPGAIHLIIHPGAGYSIHLDMAPGMHAQFMTRGRYAGNQ